MMSREERSTPRQHSSSALGDSADLRAAPLSAENQCPFGPVFFVGQLAGLLRERCPDPSEARPVVELHLFGGEVLDVCHIVGLAMSYVALAVYAAPAGTAPRPMRTELVPYATIARVSISLPDTDERHVGFDIEHRPFVVDKEHRQDAAEVLMRLASTTDVGRNE